MSGTITGRLNTCLKLLLSGTELWSIVVGWCVLYELSVLTFPWKLAFRYPDIIKGGTWYLDWRPSYSLSRMDQMYFSFRKLASNSCQDFGRNDDRGELLQWLFTLISFSLS